MGKHHFRLRRLATAAFVGFAVVTMALTGKAATGDAGKLITEGLTHWEQSRPDQAEASFKAALKEDPSSLDAHLKLGGFYLAKADYQAAVGHFQSAIGIDPTNSKVFAVLGMTYLHQGKTPLAQAAVQEALRIDPELKAAKDLMKMVEARLEREANPAPEGLLHSKPKDAATPDKPAAAGNK
ncbi:tetratricopeptide repeat protein [Magnetospira sp. QH-2]|uniref:tetratricopeptide repeat protein n=1 Tax=Magnetospira sp. (strain QH-2) TaxID=1288970 RepID=UPI0003E81334|nr:tetratricopeptide repeat protein [Magnetospira sp. QH-2]CCQ73698.1 Exported protein of unknown function. Containing tetratricopeptide repeat [Magnetospira sp. QH-2]